MPRAKVNCMDYQMSKHAYQLFLFYLLPNMNEESFSSPGCNIMFLCEKCNKKEAVK